MENDLLHWHILKNGGFDAELSLKLNSGQSFKFNLIFYIKDLSK